MGTTGLGTTIAAVGTSFTGRVQRISPLEESVQDLDDTGLDSVDYEELTPSDLAKVGKATVDVLVDSADMTLPPLGSVDTWTITTPSGMTVAGTGYISRRLHSELTPRGRMRYVFDLQFDGKTGPTINQP